MAKQIKLLQMPSSTTALRMVLVTLSFLVFFSSTVFGQGRTGVFSSLNKYNWIESFAVTTTEVDTIFTDQYESCTIHADTVDLWVKFAAPTVTDMDNLAWFLIPVGGKLDFGVATPLRRLVFKSVSGSGRLYITGSKAVPQ